MAGVSLKNPAIFIRGETQVAERVVYILKEIHFGPILTLSQIKITQFL